MPTSADFTTMYDAHAAELLRYLWRRCGDRAQAEDLLSVVFLEAWRRPRSASRSGPCARACRGHDGASAASPNLHRARSTSMSPPDVPYIPDALAHPHPARRAALLSELRERPAPRHRRRLALAVTRDGDTLELRIQDAGASGEELTRDLQEAGIDGEVRVIPVPPDMVGTWAAIEEASKRPFDPNHPTTGREEIVRLDRIEYGRELLRIPVAKVRESEGHFILWAGRAARPGEDVAPSRAAFDRWFVDMHARERHPTP
jgi:hypothetical protein